MRVSSLDVVEALDVLADGARCSFVRRVLLVIDELGANGAEEALCDGIVPTVALATHAGHEAAAGESGSVFSTGVGTAAIRMVHEAGAGTTSAKTTAQR